jgi:type II secretory pathway component PulL
MAHWRWSDWLVTLLVCTLFLSAMMTSRWLQYWRYYLSTQAP